MAAHPALFEALEAPSERRSSLEQIGALERKMDGAVKERAAAERMFAEAAISKKRFEELHAPLESRVREFEGKLAGLRKKLAALPEHLGRPPELIWRSLWPTWPKSRRRRIIATFVSAFVVSADEVEIAYLLPEPSGSKETTEPQQTRSPTNQPTPASGQGGPVYIRLPKPGEKCPISGLSRAKMNELILPNERNHFKPPVASKSLRKKGSTRGVRLVLLESLMAYLSGSP